MAKVVLSIEGRKVLFISYNGMLDPLGQSQVIPYLRVLSERGAQFTLLSFERSQAYTPEGHKACAELRRELAAAGIDWHWLRYHKSPSLPATFYDVMAGRRCGSRLVRDKQIEMVHARSYIPAAIALRLKRRFGLKMIFDVRGLMADEYFDAGHWRKESAAYRITKAVERRALAAADGVVTLTERIWPIINVWDGLRDHHIAHEVVPCCADLELFKFSQSDRERRRQELGLEDRFVVVYSGSIGGWYLTASMADFFAVLLKQKPQSHALWLTTGNHDLIRTLMKTRGIEEKDYTLLATTTAGVPSYLSASDAGLAFIKPCFSKLASSPTKYAEYLACGLPLIINAGIGDSDTLVTREQTGVLVQEFSQDGYQSAIAALEDFVVHSEQTRRRNREVAERLFDVRRVGVERYVHLYESVLGTTD
ncbi:MAG TPA: glycosyltransferase [Pyrinomonadaceae bacterium]|nr:glycosyltransferase [Pyrinomonadaceae bacterium]